MPALSHDAQPAPDVCPFCGSTNVKPATKTELVVYYRCERCAQVWSVPRADVEPLG